MDCALGCRNGKVISIKAEVTAGGMGGDRGVKTSCSGIIVSACSERLRLKYFPNACIVFSINSVAVVADGMYSCVQLQILNRSAHTKYIWRK